MVKVDVVCDNCGKIVKKFKCYTVKFEHHYCSQKCYGESIRKRLIRNYRIKDSYVEVDLTSDKIGLLSLDDEDLAKCNWNAMHITIGLRDDLYYMARSNNRKVQFVHVIIMQRILGRELNKDEQVDHIDRNGLNNKRDNLRVATRVQNRMNSGKRKSRDKPPTSQYKGVHLINGKYWCSRITINKKRIVLGYFKNEIEAAKAYDEAAKEYYGDYAYLNFSED